MVDCIANAEINAQALQIRAMGGEFCTRNANPRERGDAMKRDAINRVSTEDDLKVLFARIANPRELGQATRSL